MPAFPVMHGWFRDVLFLPAAVPVYLWIERRLGVRAGDDPPTWRELTWLFVVWSVAAEGIAPMLFEKCTADAFDVLAYGGGGIVAGLWWAWWYRPAAETEENAPRANPRANLRR